MFLTKACLGDNEGPSFQKLNCFTPPQGATEDPGTSQKSLSPKGPKRMCSPSSQNTEKQSTVREVEASSLLKVTMPPAELLAFLLFDSPCLLVCTFPDHQPSTQMHLTFRKTLVLPGSTWSFITATYQVSATEIDTWASWKAAASPLALTWYSLVQTRHKDSTTLNNQTVNTRESKNAWLVCFILTCIAFQIQRGVYSTLLG